MLLCVCFLFIYLGVIFCHDRMSYIEAILVIDRMFHGRYIAAICQELAVNEPSGFNYMGTALPHQSLPITPPVLIYFVSLVCSSSYLPSGCVVREGDSCLLIYSLFIIDSIIKGSPEWGATAVNRRMKMNWFSQQSSLNEIHRF